MKSYVDASIGFSVLTLLIIFVLSLFNVPCWLLIVPASTTIIAAVFYGLYLGTRKSITVKCANCGDTFSTITYKPFCLACQRLIVPGVEVTEQIRLIDLREWREAYTVPWMLETHQGTISISATAPIQPYPGGTCQLAIMRVEDTVLVKTSTVVRDHMIESSPHPYRKTLPVILVETLK